MAAQGNWAQVDAALTRVALKVEAAEEPIEEVGAEIISSIAATLAPKLSGHLSASTDDNGSKVVADTPYAGYVEFGSRHNKAQPFMRPAADRGGPLWRQAAGRIVTAVTR